MAPKSTTAAPKATKTPSTVSFGNPNGFAPEVWGPNFWFTIHLVAAAYPVQPTQQEKDGYEAFFRSLQFVLPCAGCRQGYETIMTSDPTKLTKRVFASRESLFKWTVDAHNRVNAKLKKPVRSNYKAWYQEYDKFR